MWLGGNIDKDSFTPVYHQIAQIIKQYIENNSLGNNDLIPSERELCEAFGASRMTVRQALNLLVNDGLLVRQKGKGTFVKTPKLRQPLTSLTSFTLDMTSQGIVPKSRVVSCKDMRATDEVIEKLELKDRAKVACLERVRLANDNPHAYECSYMLLPEAAPVLRADFTSLSLYQFLRETCNLRLVRAKEFIEVSECPEHICKLLDIPKKALTFHMSRITYDHLNRPFEYVESHYLVDKFKFEVEMDLEAK